MRNAATIYLSLGSNLGDRRAYIEQAITMLQQTGLEIIRRSSWYETAPRDLENQPWFLNIVVEARTTLVPLAVLEAIRTIESLLGRQRIVDKGPRTIDVDIILYGDVILHTPELQIPHPRMCERRFVLEPLAEIAADWRHPETGRRVVELLDSVADQPLRRLNPED